MKHRHHRNRRIRRAQGTLSPEVLEMMPGLDREFRERFGRDPGPEDPILWSDRSGTEPVPMTESEIEQLVWDMMEKAGFDPTKRLLNEHMRLKPMS